MGRLPGDGGGRLSSVVSLREMFRNNFLKWLQLQISVSLGLIYRLCCFSEVNRGHVTGGNTLEIR